MQLRVASVMFTDHNTFMAFAGVESVQAAFYILAATVLVIILLKVVLRAGPRPNLPPGPTGLPLIGSFHLLSALPHQDLAELANKYGPLMSLRLGQALCIVASSPETAMEFLHTQGANFSSRPPFRATEVVFYGQDITSLNASNPVWRQLRTIFKTELTGPKRLEATRIGRAEEIGRLIRTLPQKREIELRAYLSVTLINSISLLMLNRRLGARVGEEHGAEEQNLVAIKDIIEISKEIERCLSAFHPGDYIPGLKWLDLQGLEKLCKDTSDCMDSFASKVIADHVAERKLGTVVEEDKDMMHVLLDEVEKTDAKHQIKITNLKAVFWNAFFGGVDTILGTTEWAMSEVLRKPEVMARAQAELDAVVGQHRRVYESDIPNLVYIQAIVNETMRLHPLVPVLVPHQSINACQAFGYDIPAGTRLFVNVWAIGRDSNMWSNPGEFTPERFLSGGTNAGIETKGRHFELLPFGAGRRMCPGMGLGLLALQLYIASLLHAFEWTDVTNDLDMAEREGFLASRAVPLQVIVKPRPAFGSYT